jgi:hypothetical protein
MRQIDIINQQLSVDPGEAYRDDFHGMLADLAISDGKRFVQPYEGLPVATPKHIPARLASGVEHIVPTPPYNSELVFEYVDGRNRTHPYVGMRSLNAFRAKSGVMSEGGHVYKAFDVIKEWCPDELIVYTDKGHQLGISLEALPGIANVIADRRAAPQEIGASERPRGLTLKEQRIFVEFCRAALNPSESYQ